MWRRLCRVLITINDVRCYTIKMVTGTIRRFRAGDGCAYNNVRTSVITFTGAKKSSRDIGLDVNCSVWMSRVDVKKLGHSTCDKVISKRINSRQKPTHCEERLKLCSNWSIPNEENPSFTLNVVRMYAKHCTACNHLHVGETGRHHGDRIRNHILRDFAVTYNTKPLSRHLNSSNSSPHWLLFNL